MHDMIESGKAKQILTEESERIDKQKRGGDKTLVAFNAEAWVEGVMKHWTEFTERVPVGTNVRLRNHPNERGITENGGYYDNPLVNTVPVGEGRNWLITLVEGIPQ